MVRLLLGLELGKMATLCEGESRVYTVRAAIASAVLPDGACGAVSSSLWAGWELGLVKGLSTKIADVVETAAAT